MEGLNFELTEDKFPTIAEELGVDENLIEEFSSYFNKFYKTIRYQHLAHIIRAMEVIVREKDKNPSFRIEWKSMPNDENINSAISLKWPNKFGIVVPAKLVTDKDLIELRVHVAHELGHLFYITYYPDKKGDKDLNHKMANVFGVFTLLERNRFYYDEAPNMCHKKWEDVVADFKKLDEQRKL